MEPAGTPPRFTLDALSATDQSWQAREYGTPWNGWLTPVVDRETLEQVLAAASERHTWDGEAVRLLGWMNEPEEDHGVLIPRSDALYDLGELGWTFVVAEDAP